VTANPAPDNLDRVIHEPGRLRLVAALAAREEMTFAELKEALAMTDGNLSTHARVLEEAGYIKATKDFVGRKPRTTMKITAQGREAFRVYVEYLGQIISPRKKS
jgi:DNA-binding transcriptional ArsR family regulator